MLVVWNKHIGLDWNAMYRPLLAHYFLNYSSKAALPLTSPYTVRSSAVRSADPENLTLENQTWSWLDDPLQSYGYLNFMDVTWALFSLIMALP